MTRWTLAISLVAALSLQTAEANPFRVGRGDQLKLGKRAAADIRKKEKVLPATDARVVKLREVADRILRANPVGKDSRGQAYPWEFTFDIIDSKDVNAFALPGGPIFFFTGLLDKFKTEDQMAAVLSHEMVHITKEHWSAAYARQQERSLLLTGALILLGANRTATDIASIGNEVLLTLPNSRGNESEADTLGMAMMVKAGFNPTGMADVMRTLGEATKGQRPPEWMSTHPNDRNRVRRIEDQIAKMNQEFAPQVPLTYGVEATVWRFREAVTGPSMGELFYPHAPYRACCAHH